MMSTYLKLDAELPAGLNYLNINSISSLPSSDKVGSIVYASHFSDGITDLVGNSEIVTGTPSFDSLGTVIGSDCYIDTGIDVALQQTLIIATKRLVADSGPHLQINSYLDGSMSSDTKAHGISVTSLGVYYDSTANSITSASAALPQNQWSIIAVSRNAGVYNFAGRSNGSTLLNASANGYASLNPELPRIHIGGSPKISIGAVTSTKRASHSRAAYAAVHNKFLTQSELLDYVNALALDLNQRNAAYSL